jgi:membrane protein required for colicin V production
MSQFDIIVYVSALIFLTLGFFKGAIRSILGLAKWYGAGVVTVLFYPQIRELVDAQIGAGMVANGVAIIGTYIVALVALSILISIFLTALGSTVGGGSDRIMGAMVGITIAAIIVSTGHYFLRSFNGGADPDWLRGGKTYSLTNQGANILQSYFKDVVKGMGVDLGLAKNMDPTGDIANKIKEFQNETGSDIDYAKLKDAIRMMKEDGMAPDQIKDLINIQDYMAVSQEAGQTMVDASSGDAEAIVNQATEELKKLKNAMPNSMNNEAPIGLDDQE